MGSHYIPVGKLKIDKEILDIACPAAGYTPEIICPTAGWTPPYEFEEPEEWPVLIPQNGTIQLLITDAGDLVFYCIVTGTNQYNLRIYGLDDSLIAEYASVTGGTYTYSIPKGLGYAGSGYTYYKCIITAQFGSGNLDKFSLGNSPSPTEVLSVLINAPTLSSLAYLGRYQILLRRVVFSQEEYPNLSTLYYAFNNLLYLEEVLFPTSMPALTTLAYSFTSTNCKKITFPSILPKVTTIQGMFNLARYGDLILPEMPKLTTMLSAFQDAIFNKVEFQGGCDFLTSISSSFRDASIKFVILPNSFNNLLSANGWFSTSKYITFCEKLELPITNESITSLNQTFNGRRDLREIVLPAYLPNLTTMYNMVYNCESLISISPVNSGSSQVDARLGYVKSLTQFNMPNLKCTVFQLRGTSSVKTKVESIEVDWANSDWSYGTLSQVILIDNNNLDATEIDRIFTALPTVSGGQTINVTGNPGAATCNPAIAEAKGWTVV